MIRKVLSISSPLPQAFPFPLFHQMQDLQGEAFCCDSHGLGTKAPQLPHSKELLSQFYLVLFVSCAQSAKVAGLTLPCLYTCVQKVPAFIFFIFYRWRLQYNDDVSWSCTSALLASPKMEEVTLVKKWTVFMCQSSEHELLFIFQHLGTIGHFISPRAPATVSFQAIFFCQIRK